MAEDDVMFGVGFMPNFDKLEEDIENQEFKTEVDLEADNSPLEAGMPGDGGAAGAGGGGGDGGEGMAGIAGMIEPLLSMSKKLATLVSLATVLLMLEPITQTLSLLLRLLEISVLPFIILLVTLLRPFIQAFLRILPALADFARDPFGNLGGLVNALGDVLGRLAKRIGKQLGDAWSRFSEAFMAGLEGLFGGLVDAIVTRLKQAVNMLTGVIPGVDKPFDISGPGGRPPTTTGPGGTPGGGGGTAMLIRPEALPTDTSPGGDAGDDGGTPPPAATGLIPDLSDEAQKEKQNQDVNSQNRESFGGGL